MINLYEMPNEVMIIINYPTGIFYENQVGGYECRQVEFEGVLAPVGIWPEANTQIMELPFPGAGALGVDVADRIDEILASNTRSQYLKVDRSRLDDSCEAWVFVHVETPENGTLQLVGPYFGAPHGFGTARGVLTWPNSD
jgi:hypothetical protein